MTPQLRTRSTRNIDTLRALFVHISSARFVSNVRGQRKAKSRVPQAKHQLVMAPRWESLLFRSRGPERSENDIALLDHENEKMAVGKPIVLCLFRAKVWFRTA